MRLPDEFEEGRVMLKVVETARKIQAISENAGQGETGRRIASEVLGYIDKAEVTVAVLGEFSSGKSSLLNRLLDTDVLPVKAEPTTAVVTAVVTP